MNTTLSSRAERMFPVEPAASPKRPVRRLRGSVALCALGLATAFSSAVLLDANVAHAQTTNVQPSAPAVRRFALVISSNDGGASRTRLRFADSDAKAMADVLQHLGGLHRQDLTLLNGATRGSLEAAFDQIKASIEAAKGDKARREVFIYYSGHSDENGLMLGGEHVSYAQLRQWLEATGADVRIAVLDSCASGAMIRLRGGTRKPSFLSDVSIDARGHAFLTASSASEAAQESDRIGAAFFTHYLVSGLRGAADNNRDGRVTLNEAYQFAYNETLGRTVQTAAGAQHPAYDIQLAGTGDLVLTDVRSTDASLVLGQDVSGRVYVRDPSDHLLVELRKEPLHPVELGLAPGDYEVALDRDGHHFGANVSLTHGSSARVDQSQFVATTPLRTVSRGTAEPVAAVATPEPASTTKSDESLSDTLIGKDSLIGQTTEFGGYAGLAFNYTQFGSTDGFLATIEAALLLNRRYAIGFTAGGGISSHLNDERDYFSGGYGGLVARYNFLFDSPASFSLGAVAAAGGFSRQNDADARDGNADEARRDVDTAVFVFEPQAVGYLNVTRFARFGLHAGYRFTAFNGEKIRSSELRGVTGGLRLELGWF
jgi:uncharacterized caspase-like protein